MPPRRGGSERVGIGLSRWRLQGRDILLIQGFFLKSVLVGFVYDGVKGLKGRLVPVRPEEVTPTP